MSHPDVIVVGGGVIGLSIAWRCAARGLRVEVIDEAFGAGASWAAAGMLAPVTEAHYGEEQLLRLNLRSAAMYPRFVAELEEAAGMSVGYRRCGTLVVARDSDENAALEELYRFQLDLGLPVERLRSRDCRKLEPGLAPGVRGGIHVEGDHQIDNRALLVALERACRRAAVELSEGLVKRVDLRGGRVAGIALQTGEFKACDTVIVAAGCHSGDLGLPDEIALPIRPVKGQLLHLRTHTGVPPAVSNIRGVDVYIVSRSDGRVVIGATVEEQGFDLSVTAGGVYALLRDAYELLPGVIDMELSETAVGLRPATPDNAPLLGDGGVAGLVIATGHYRNGVLLAPVTAEAIAGLAGGDEVPAEVAPFSPRRFQRVAS